MLKHTKKTVVIGKLDITAKLKISCYTSKRNSAYFDFNLFLI